MRISRIRCLVAGTLSTVALVSTATAALADSRNPYRVDIRPTLQQELSGRSPAHLVNESQAWSRLATPIRFSSHFFGDGVVEVALNEAHAKNWRASFVGADGTRSTDRTVMALLRGTALRRDRGRSAEASRRERQQVRGVLFERDGIRTLHVYLRGEGASGTTRYYRIAVKRSARTGKMHSHLSRAPEYALYGKLGVHSHSGEMKHPTAHVSRGRSGVALISGAVPITASPEVAPLSTSALTAEIAMQGDHSLYESAGDSANAEIASIMNTVNGIYEADLGMNFTIVDTTVLTSSGPYPSSMTASEDLLDTFRLTSGADNTRPNADVYHLIVGRDMDGDTVGLAYVGVVCSATDYAYGLSQYFNPSITPPITAHELGHNFNADHVSTGIMSAVLSDPLPEHFSSQSISQISSYVSANSDCLTTSESVPTPDATPTPTPSLSSPHVSLRTSVRGTSFRATLNVDEILDGCVVTLRGSPSRANVASGNAIFTVVPTSSSVVASATIRFRARSGNAYFIAESSCSDREVAYSAVRSGAVSRMTGRRAVTVASWLARLRGLFAEVTEN